MQESGSSRGVEGDDDLPRVCAEGRHDGEGRLFDGRLRVDWLCECHLGSCLGFCDGLYLVGVGLEVGCCAEVKAGCLKLGFGGWGCV